MCFAKREEEKRPDTPVLQRRQPQRIEDEDDDEYEDEVPASLSLTLVCSRVFQKPGIQFLIFVSV